MHSKITSKIENKMLALSICFPQLFSIADHTFSTCRSRLDTTDQLVRFYKNEFDVKLCKLDSAGNMSSIEKYPIPH